MVSSSLAARKLSLTANDALLLYLKASKGQKIPSELTMLLPAKRPAHIDFASLLSAHATVHAVSPDPKTHALAESRGLKSTLVPAHLTGSRALRNRFAAWIAVRSSHRAVVLPETAYDDAILSLSTRDGALPSVSCIAEGAEMLPRRALTFVRPLLPLSPDQLSESMPPIGVAIDDARAHGSRRLDAITALMSASDALLRESVLEASHWGYLVMRRSVLAEHYNASPSERLVALSTFARAMAHVSGTHHRLSATSELVTRTADCIFALNEEGFLNPLPKGRTAAGMVIRRATGRFARSISELDAETRRRRAQTVRSNMPDDLMILTREPDHESTGLLARRLGGNAACTALNGATYWDNRYVMLASPVDELRDGVSGALQDNMVLEAILRPPSGKTPEEEMRDCEFYARQLRRVDWERITAVTERVRNFQIPFECIRALPGVFERPKAGIEQGVLAASPHLGLSFRQDTCFTAVRVPRFRTLPPDVCPGFVVEEDREMRYAVTRLTRDRLGMRGGTDGRGKKRGRGSMRSSRSGRLSDAFV